MIADSPLKTLHIDLSGLEMEDVEVLFQQGSKGMPDFAASSGDNCIERCSSSCGKVCASSPVDA